MSRVLPPSEKTLMVMVSNVAKQVAIFVALFTEALGIEGTRESDSLLLGTNQLRKKNKIAN